MIRQFIKTLFCKDKEVEEPNMGRMIYPPEGVDLTGENRPEVQGLRLYQVNDFNL